MNFFEDLFNWSRNYIPYNKDWIMLEFGIGKHGFGSLYKNHVNKVFGLDIYDYSAQHPGVDFILSDGNSIPLPDESVNLVVSHSVLEHVASIEQSVSEIFRVLKVGGFAFLTVSPLYFSSEGSHISSPVKLDNWEHLNEKSSFYMLQNTSGQHGDNLNGLTISQFLGAIGSCPFDIHRLELRHDTKRAPDFIPPTISEMDKYIREFRFVGYKRIRLTTSGPASITY